MLIVLGVGYAWVEVAGLTLMQRLVSDEVLARVFGVVESTYVASTGIGAVVAPIAVAAFGNGGALVAVGTGCRCWRWRRGRDTRDTRRLPRCRAPVCAAALAAAVGPARARDGREPRLEADPVTVAPARPSRRPRRPLLRDRRGPGGGGVRRRADAHRGPGRVLRRDRAAARRAADGDGAGDGPGCVALERDRSSTA